MGYGILGRVITNVAGAEYREVVRDRLLGPLGMTATAYLEEEVPEPRLAHGYVRREEALVREGADGYGALASMGGVFTSVRDLSRWVAGFLDAFPARDDPEGPHPLRRASRREMQQVQRAFGPWVAEHAPDAEPVATAGGYGLGLFVLRDVELGTTVSHAGGYPGYGTHMAWHPATGLGVIGLGNLRYAPVRPVVAEVLAMLVRADVAPRRRVVPGAAVAAMRPVVERLLERWDDAAADEVFAMNMDLDEPRELRRAAVAKVTDEVGPLRPSEEHGGRGPLVAGGPAARRGRERGRDRAGGAGGRGALRLAAPRLPGRGRRAGHVDVRARDGAGRAGDAQGGPGPGVGRGHRGHAPGPRAGCARRGLVGRAGSRRRPGPRLSARGRAA
ncbi:MAG: serine hydrolase domain-containing protein [Chloroflexota bacterium]